MTDMWHIAKVLEKVAPDNWLSCGLTYDSIVWKDATKAVAESIIKEEHDIIVAAYKAQEYTLKRQAEYPSIQELVVALYDTDDKSAVEAKRAAVKAKYPKG